MKYFYFVTKKNCKKYCLICLSLIYWISENAFVFSWPGTKVNVWYLVITSVLLAFQIAIIFSLTTSPIEIALGRHVILEVKKNLIWVSIQNDYLQTILTKLSWNIVWLQSFSKIFSVSHRTWVKFGMITES